MSPDFLKQRLDLILEQSPLSGLSNDLKVAVNAQLQNILINMNLVTREEFDAQLAVLIRCQEQLTRMEARLAELESLLDDKTN